MILTLFYTIHHNPNLIYRSVVLVGTDVTFELLSSSDILWHVFCSTCHNIHPGFVYQWPSVESVWCSFTKQQFGVGMQGQVNLFTSREMLLPCNCAPKLTQ